MNTTTKKSEQIEFTRVNSDVNGNPRYVCHFLNFINEGDRVKAGTRGMSSISEMYAIALQKAKQLGGRKYHNKQYGGGIVFQSYNIADEARKIEEIKKTNINFIKEWTPKQFKQAEKAIYNHFIKYTYQWQPTHEVSSRKPLSPLHIINYEALDNLLGLAYTSTGRYAGLWVCNAGYLMATDTHHFSGFAINTDGQVIGIVQDENENEIFIEL